MLPSEPDFLFAFPLLQPAHCVGDFSAATRQYNCFAWAASVDDQRWEPDPLDQYYWPDNIPREYTVDAFISAYRSLGYDVCTDGSREENIEKIAFFVRFGRPTHAARQLENGNWTTKFGDFEDVEHIDLTCLSGPAYGSVQIYMKRKRGAGND